MKHQFYPLLVFCLLNLALHAQTQLPPPPINVTAIAVNSHAIRVSFTDNLDYEFAYHIQYATSPDGPFSQGITTIGASALGGTVSFDYGEYQPNTTVYARVSTFLGGNLVEGDDGMLHVDTVLIEGPPSAVVFATTFSADNYPAAPSDFTATVVGKKVQLTWTDNANNEHGFHLSRSFYGTTYEYDFPPDTNHFTDSIGIEKDVDLTYYLQAVSEFGYGEDPVSVTTMRHSPALPVPPQMISATGVTPFMLELRFIDQSDTEYEYEVSFSTTYPEFIVSLDNYIQSGAPGTGSIVTCYPSENLKPNTTYYMRVRGYYLDEDYHYPVYGDYSEIISATTTGPKNFQATQEENNIRLTWTAYNDYNQSVFIVRSDDGINFTDLYQPLNDTTYVDTTALPNVTYTYKMQAYGNSGPVYDLFTVTATVQLSLQPPAIQLASFVTPTSFTANWTAVPNADYYKLFVFTVNDSTALPGYDGVVVNGTSQAVSGTAPLKHYAYYVKAVNSYTTSGRSGIMPVTIIKDLTLRTVCSDNPVVSRRWKIINGNTVPVSVTWSVVSTSQTGTHVATLGESFFSTPTTTGLNYVTISWLNDKLVQLTSTKSSMWKPCVVIDTTTVVEEKLWGIDDSGIFSLNKDGTDFLYYHHTSDTTHGSNDIGFRTPGVLIKNGDGELIGSTLYHDSYRSGTIFKINSNGITVLTPLEFGKTVEGDGLSLYQNYVYATISTGVGHIIRIKQDGTGYEKIYQFKGSDGRNPYGKVIDGGDGYLYGMTFSGGLNNEGVIYRLKPDGTSFQKLYDFSTAMGKTPYGSLLNLNDEFLYGLTATGGAANLGVIFKIKRDGTGYTKLYEFDTVHGSKPYGSLIQASNGSLYGMTTYGGTAKGGVIFKINPDGSDFEVISNLALGNPKGALTEDSNGYLYGIASSSIFKIKLDGTDLQVIGGKQGYGPFAGHPYPSLALLESKKLTPDVYVKSPPDGTTDVDRNTDLIIQTRNVGTSYTLQLSGEPDFSSVVVSMTQADTVFDIPALTGGTTYYARVKTNSYPLFGKTTTFKTHEGPKRLWGALSGSIYHINLDGSGFEYAFTTASNGDLHANPRNIIQLRDGSIVGTTNYGGFEDSGDIFKIDAQGLKILHNWGAYALGARTQFAEGSDGFIYGIGITPAPSAGHIFKVKSNGDNFETKYFKKGGFYPSGYITKASNGTLYGMCSHWIYKIKSDMSGLDIIYNFSSATTGKALTGELTEGPDGFLYGTTTTGGSHKKGSIFKIKVDGQQFTKLHDFNGTEGASPLGGLIFDAAGTLYGVAGAGQYGKGVLYKMNMDGSGFTVLQHFTEGMSPEGHLVLGNDQIIYGAIIGYYYDGGQIFSINKNGTGYTKLIDFPSGDYPNGRVLLLDETFDPHETTSLTSTARVAQVTQTQAVVENNAITIFPNPTVNDFTVEVKTDTNESVQFTVYDMNGASLYQAEDYSNQPHRLGKELKSGVYILEVMHSNKATYHRLVKQ